MNSNMKLDKKHPMRSLQKLCDKYLKDLAKRGVEPHDPYKATFDAWRQCKDPGRVKATQEAMRRAENQERKRYPNRVPRIMVTAPPPEMEKKPAIQSYPGSKENQAASASNNKAKPTDKSMTLQVPGARKKVAFNAGKGDLSKKAGAGKASSKTTPAVASSSPETPPNKASSSNGTKRKASSEDTIPKTPRKRFRTMSSRRPRKPNPDQEYRSHWDPFISKHRCSKCNQPVDDDNHCYNGHRITPLKPRTRSGELIREMSQEEMIAEEQAGPPYRQEIYDSEEDDRFGRIQEGMYTDDEEEGLSGFC